MKTLFTTAVLIGGMLMFAGTANAASQWQCQQYAQNQTDSYAPNGQGMVAGGLLGALGGAGIASITHGNAGTGALIGGVGGAVVGGTINQDKRQQIYNQAYYSCMNGGGYARPNPGYAQPMYAQPVYAPPPLSGQATVTTTANVRSGPGTQYPVMSTLFGGTVVSIGQCVPGWCSIGMPGGQGWMSRSLLY
jgi:hypothetical protein